MLRVFSRRNCLCQVEAKIQIGLIKLEQFFEQSFEFFVFFGHIYSIGLLSEPSDLLLVLIIN